MQAPDKDATTVSTQDVQTLERFAEQNLQASRFSEVLERVPSLVQRGAVYLITAVLLLSFGLLYVGQAHVVVTAKGKIVPEGESVQVQAREGGVVAEIAAQVGDRLPAGAPLLKLDHAQSGLNLAAITRKLALQEHQMQELQTAAATTQRIVADPEGFLRRDEQAVMTGSLVLLLNALRKAWLDMQNTRQFQIQGFRDKKKHMLSEIELTQQKIAVLDKNRRVAMQDLAREEEDLQRKKKRLEEFRQLVERGMSSELELDGELERYRAAEAALAEHRRQIDQMALDLSNERLRTANLQLTVRTEETDSDKQSQLAMINYRQSLTSLHQGLDDLRADIKKLEVEINNTRGELQLAESQLTHTTITMPVTGTVIRMEVKDPGTMVGTGGVVAGVVPDGAPLVIQATVPNKDIGFVRAGLPARIKVDAYPFQQFGTVPGQVLKVFPNVGSSEHFTVTLALLQGNIATGEHNIQFFPGLTVQAELLIRKQRLFNLLFSKQADGQGN
jgi:HlyD family secretion protein